MGQGLAGTIDLRTIRPLQYGRRAMAFNIRGEQNSNDSLGADASDNGYRTSFSYIDQYLDGRFGIALGVARLDSPLATRGAGTYEPWHPNGTPYIGQRNPTAIANPGVSPSTFVTDGIKVRTDMGTNVRDGAMAVLEFRPNDRYSTILDLYYTQRDQKDNARSLEVNLGCYPALCSGPFPNQGDGVFPLNSEFGFSNSVIVDNTVVGGDLNRVVPLARNFLFKTQDEIFAAGWNNKFTMDEWTVTADLSYSKATRDEQQYEINAQYEADVRPDCSPTVTTNCHPPDEQRNVYDNGHFQLQNGSMPSLTFGLDYADPTQVQIGPTIYGAGYSKIPHVEDELNSVRIDVERFLGGGWFASVAAGANYSDRTKDKVQPERGLSTNGGGGYFQVESQYLLAPTNLSYAGAGNALALDVQGVLSAYYQPIVYATPTTPGFDYLIGKNWSVEEKVTTAYLRGGLDRELSENITLKGNIGLQLVQTDQSSIAFTKDQVNNLVVPFTDGKTYDDVLPAINFAFLLPGQQAVRVGIARELARARMDQLKASSEVGYNQLDGRPSGSGGNPRLSPWRADAFDLSYEKYLEDGKGYISIAAFYKDLKTYIYNQTDQTFDFSVFPTPTFPPGYFPPGVTPQTIGSFKSPVNGKGGNLSGLEFAVSLPGEIIAEALDGFGAILSISQTDSNIKIQDPPGNNFLTGNNLGTIPLPGLSETVWNATLYYEKSGFSARVATRARSKYIGEVTNFANDRAFKYVRGDQITDLQVGYAFESGRLEGLSVLFQVNNLTNEPYIAYSVIEARQQDFQDYGRQFLLGINYRR
jgi:TonB-dependent receptor